MKALFITKLFFMEPLGLMYLASAAKDAGHEVKLAVVSGDLEERISDYQPDVIGYSVMTGDQKFYLSLNNRLKSNFRFVSIFGGPHPTFFPDIIKEEQVDIICRGEGEEAFVDLLNSMAKGGDISKILNLTVKNNEEIICNDLRHYSNLNSLPFPDRDLLSIIPIVRHGPIKHFMASRGCPFNCSYCFNEKYSKLYFGKGEKVRFRQPDSIINEINEVVMASPTRFIYFQDDTFTINREWLGQFLERYAEEIGLPFHCHVRPGTIDGENINLLKKAGCYSVHIAAECGSDRIRNDVLKRNISREQIVNASEILRSNNIRFMLQNMIGLPTGNLEDDFSTLELNIECKPDYAWVSIFQPYPGTKIGEYCKREGIYTGNFDDIESNFFDSSKLNFSEEYKVQISNLQKLFAIFVEYPELHRLGLSRSMINAINEESRESYKRAYKEFRGKADEKLYGFRI